MISGRPHHRKLQDAEKRRRRLNKEKMLRKIAKLRADYQKLQESFSERTSVHTDREVRMVNTLQREFRPPPPVKQPAPGTICGGASHGALLIPVVILLIWLAYLIAKGGSAQ